LLVAGKIEFMEVISLEIPNSGTYIYELHMKWLVILPKETFMKGYIAIILNFLFIYNIRDESTMKKALLHCIQS
jgi:hypothetical protein